jgi:hypothetical protein
VIPESWWQSPKLWAPLLGVVLGFILAEAKDWLVRRRRSRAHWAALRAEIEFCRRMAETYSQDRVMAPLYRLPTAAYSQSFPALLADGLLTESETYSMIQFFTEVETLNRGLDLAQAARERNDDHALQAEFDRNLLKAQGLMPHEVHAQDYYQPARAAVDAHL